MMEIGVEDLAEIFEDPLLNDLTDNLLSDIDLQELENFPIDYGEEPNKFSLQNSPSVEKSNHATLEALLKSQPPRPSVPPAPDLHSNVHLPSNIETRPTQHLEYNCWNMHNQDRSSNPIPISQYGIQKGKPKMEMPRISPKSRLICDYLEKCPTEPPSRFLRPALEINQRSRHSGNTGGTQLEISESENDSPQRTLLNNSNCFHVNSSSVWGSNTDTDDCDASSKNADRPAKRAPHNAIEKRYRASINGRIDELRKILIPFPSADAKLNKSAVLRQAIERIKELEARNERLYAEVISLRRLHAGHMSKSYNSSPESGISLDPSPTSFNYACPEFGRITPSSISDSYGSTYNLNGTMNNCAPITSCSTEYPNSCTIPDTCTTTPWSLTMSSPEKPDSAFPSGTVPLDVLMDDYTLFDRGGSSYRPTVGDDTAVTPPNVCQYLIHGDSIDQTYQQSAGGQVHTKPTFTSVVETTSNRGKRVACTTEPGPLKVRRELAPNSITDGQFVSTAPAQTLKRSPSDSFAATMIKADAQLPGVRGLLLNQPQPGPVAPGQPAQPAESTTRKLVNYVVPAGGFNDLAARTTLCVSALCLVALDPAALTTTSSGSSGQQSISTTRRLLTTSSLFTSPFSTWVNCLLYLVQWIVALFLCFWAWRRGTVRGAFRTPEDTQFGEHDTSTTARSHWIKATAALDQGAITLSERHLRQCLDVLNANLPEVPANDRSFRRAWEWCAVGLYAYRLLCIQAPYGMCKFMFSKLAAWLIPSQSTCSTDCINPTPSPTMVRSRLLELYLLEHNEDNTAATLHVDSLSFARLFLACCRDFVDVPIRLRSDAECTESAEWTRHGIVLVLVFSQVFKSAWLGRFVMRWITAYARLNLDNKTSDSIWLYLTTNPCFASVLTGRRVLALPPVISGPTVLYRFPDRLRSALSHELSEQCLRVILYGTHRELNSLKPTIDALLHLFPTTATTLTNDCDEGYSVEPIERDAGTASNIYAVECCRWWARLLHTIWLQRVFRQQRNSAQVSGLTDLRLEKPFPNAELTYSASGPLVQALWIVYSGAPDDCCSIAAAKEACNLLRKSMLHLSTFSGSSEKRADNPFNFDLFQMMAWHWLALDSVLTALVGSLLNSSDSVEIDTPHPVDTSTMSSLTLTLSMLRQLANSSNSSFTQPQWIRSKLSYAETVHRLANGANPVRTRLALLQYRQIMNARSAAVRSEIQKSGSRPVELIVHNTSRINNPSNMVNDSHSKHVEEESDVFSDASQHKTEQLARYFDNPRTTMTIPNGVTDHQPGLFRYNAVTQSPGQ